MEHAGRRAPLPLDERRRLIRPDWQHVADLPGLGRRGRESLDDRSSRPARVEPGARGVVRQRVHLAPSPDPRIRVCGRPWVHNDFAGRLGERQSPLHVPRRWAHVGPGRVLTWARSRPSPLRHAICVAARALVAAIVTSRGRRGSKIPNPGIPIESSSSSRSGNSKAPLRPVFERSPRHQRRSRQTRGSARNARVRCRCDVGEAARTVAARPGDRRRTAAQRLATLRQESQGSVSERSIAATPGSRPIQVRS